MRLALESDLLVVGEASSDRQAIARAPAVRPDVIVMSVDTPRIAGQVIRELLADLPGCEIIVLSLHDNWELKAQVLDDGASAFVSKHEPFDSLLATIRRTDATTNEGGSQSSFRDTASTKS